MNTTIRFALAALAAAIPSVAWAQGRVSIYLQTGPTTGSVQVHDEITGSLISSPSELADIEFQELDFVGRTIMLELLPDRPRYEELPGGASRLLLPADRGALYLYRRSTGAGSVYGFMTIRPNGEARSVLERRGIGPQSLNPFMPKVAVAPDGRSVLLATTLAAGGDLFEVSLLNGMVIPRTPAGVDLQFRPNGLALAGDWGIAISTRGVLRFDRNDLSDTSSLVPFTPGPKPRFYGKDIVLSKNTEWAVMTAGASQSELHVYAFDSTSAAVRVTQVPSRISRAGFLPETRNGPYMAVSDDGSLAAWRVDELTPEGTTSGELFLGRVPMAVPAVQDQLSADGRFLDTLDEVGQVFFFDPGVLTFAVGEREPGIDGLGMTDIDLFTARMPVGQDTPDVVNLTVSNGQVLPPYTQQSEIKPGQMVWVPDQQRFVIFDDGDAEQVISVDGALGGAQVLLDGVRDVPFMQVTSQGLVFDARRTNNQGGNWEIYRHTGAPTDPVVLLDSDPEAFNLSRSSVMPGGWVAFVAAPIGAETLTRLNVETGAQDDFTPGLYGPEVGFTSNGSLFFTRPGPSNSSEFVVWSQAGGTVTLNTPLVQGYVLPVR